MWANVYFWIMNLAVDIGNSAVKLGLFEGDQLIDAGLDAGGLEGLEQFLGGRVPRRVIVCSVRKDSGLYVDMLRAKFGELLVYPGSLRLPVKNAYRTPETLGADRIPPVIGAMNLLPGHSGADPSAYGRRGNAILVVDAGTCIKFNFLNEAAEFLGGSIAPGLEMRFKALHTFTSALPLTGADQNFDKMLGQDTRESILAGVQAGAVAEVEGMIVRYREVYQGLEVLLTGGDGLFFGKRLKNRIFVDPNLLLKGLNCILNFND